jgi:hypothetical protein
MQAWHLPFKSRAAPVLKWRDFKGCEEPYLISRFVTGHGFSRAAKRPK